jgi:hypothetical protein
MWNTVEYSLVIKRDEILTDATARMITRDTVLSTVTMGNIPCDPFIMRYIV